MAPYFRSSPLRLVWSGVAVLVLGGLLLARSPGPGRGEAAGAEARCPTGSDACRGSADAVQTTGTPTVIAASDVCLRGGYLCADLPSEGEIRIARWNEDTERIRIRVPRPSDLDAATARALQERVARGLRAWHGRPFPIRVDLSDRPGPEDFAVTWAATLGERQLGRASTRWTLKEGRADLEVTELVLVTRDPWDPERTIRPSQIELAAAHEMGHALGLPHSDEPRDVMYPENTATRLTARDYITMSSLYALENGAVVRAVRR